jgi:hypothetical protein
MYRTIKILETKLRLNEINRRFAELRVVSSKLADMAAQLECLRKLNGRVGVFIDRNAPSSPGRDDRYFSSKYCGSHQNGILVSRDLMEQCLHQKRGLFQSRNE